MYLAPPSQPLETAGCVLLLAGTQPRLRRRPCQRFRSTTLAARSTPYTLLALIALAALGCAGKSKSAAPARAQEPAAAPLQRQPDIEALDTEIRQWRVELGLTETPQPMAAGATDVDGVCGELTECKDPCDLADKICENKEKICEIAADLADPWATQKCDEATRSCEDARAICSCCEKRSAPP